MKYMLVLLALVVFTGCSTQLTAEEQFFNDYCQNTNTGIDCNDFTDAMANAEGNFVPDQCNFQDPTLQCQRFILEDNILKLDISSQSGNTIQELFTSAIVEDGSNTYSCVIDNLIECDVSGSIEHSKEGYIITLTQNDGETIEGSILVTVS